MSKPRNTTRKSVLYQKQGDFQIFLLKASDGSTNFPFPSYWQEKDKWNFIDEIYSPTNPEYFNLYNLCNGGINDAYFNDSVSENDKNVLIFKFLGKYVGVSTFSVFPNSYGHIYIDTICADSQEYSYVGTLMMDEYVKLAKENKIPALKLSSVSNAVQFYMGIGFMPDPTEYVSSDLTEMTLDIQKNYIDVKRMKHVKPAFEKLRKIYVLKKFVKNAQQNRTLKKRLQANTFNNSHRSSQNSNRSIHLRNSESLSNRSSHHSKRTTQDITRVFYRGDDEGDIKLKIPDNWINKKRKYIREENINKLLKCLKVTDTQSIFSKYYLESVIEDEFSNILVIKDRETPIGVAAITTLPSILRVSLIAARHDSAYNENAILEEIKNILSLNNTRKITLFSDRSRTEEYKKQGFWEIGNWGIYEEYVDILEYKAQKT